jgi:hypothetical protein
MATTVTTTSSSTATGRADAPAASRRVGILLAAGALTAAVSTTVIALVARAVGADGLPALQPLIYLPFVLLGFAAMTVGWAIIRARASRPATLLRVLVPVGTVLSLLAPAALAVWQFIPGTTLTGAIALGLMHLVVVGVAVPVLARALPVRDADSSGTHAV